MNNISDKISPKAVYKPPSNVIHINRVVTFNKKQYRNLRFTLGDLKNTILISKPAVFKEFTKRKRKLLSNWVTTQTTKKSPVLIRPNITFLKEFRDDDISTTISEDKNKNFIIIINNKKIIQKFKNLINKTISLSNNNTSNLNEIIQEQKKKYKRTDLLCTFHTPKTSIDIYVKDYITLNPGIFINDIVVNFYLNFLSMFYEKSSFTFNIFNTFFYPLISFKSNKGSFPELICSKPKKNLNIFDYNYLVIPIFEGNHWSIIIVTHPNKMKDISKDNFPWIIYLDSYYEKNDKCIDIIKRFLYSEYALHNGIYSREDYFTKIKFIRTFIPKVPRQPNTFDCGIFMLTYIEKFLSNPTFLEQQINELNFDLTNWFDVESTLQKRKKIKSFIYHIKMNEAQAIEKYSKELKKEMLINVK